MTFGLGLFESRPRASCKSKRKEKRHNDVRNGIKIVYSVGGYNVSLVSNSLNQVVFITFLLPSFFSLPSSGIYFALSDSQCEGFFLLFCAHKSKATFLSP